MTAPLTAPATSKPCQLYAHGVAPRPTRTQGHHRYPEYLQKRLWGETLVDDLLWVCGLCHDSIHDVIGWLLGESRMPDPMPGYKTLAEARRTIHWYQSEERARAAASA